MLIAPAARITSAVGRGGPLGAAEPVADAGGAPAVERRARSTSAPVTTRRLARWRAGRRKAFAVVQRMPFALVDLEEARPLVVAVVEVVPARDADLLGGVAKGLEDVPAQPLARDLPLAAGAVQRALAAEAVLGAAEVGQHVVPAPAGIAELAPVVVVRRLAAHVDHAVDRGAAAEHLARADSRASGR